VDYPYHLELDTELVGQVEPQGLNDAVFAALTVVFHDYMRLKDEKK
jgi:hypothetical protein